METLTKHWDVILERRSLNRLHRKGIREKLLEIAEAAARNKDLGFQARIGKIVEPTPSMDEGVEKWLYRVKLRLEKAKRVNDPAALPRQLQHVLSVVRRCAESRKWTVLSDHLREVKQECNSTNSGVSVFRLPELSQTALDTFFGGIYERSDQIEKIYAAVKMSILTEGDVLPHILLYGRPGACKTVLMERFKAWFENNNPGAERIVFVDGSSMTKAGFETWLMSLAEPNALREVVVIDEIEKQDKDNLLSLLSLMGSGIIARLNARIGNCRRRARFVVTGICNDENTLKNFRDGALWSRFGGNKLFCPRPSRELCLKLLTDMCSRIPGSTPKWAESALGFGWDELGSRDIREIKDHLCGMDKLLSGEWQEGHRRMLKAKQEEERGEVLERERLSKDTRI